MKSNIPSLNILVVVASTLLSALGAFAVSAAPLNLSRVPLYANESAEPNFILTFDDSGSMLRGYVPDSFSDANTLFPGYPHTLGAAPGFVPTKIDTRCWWVTGNWSFSPEVNSLFYNPDINYQKPIRADGTVVAYTPTFGSAKEDGILNSGTARNLNNDFRINWELGGGTNRPKIVRRATGGSSVPPNTSNGANCDDADTMYRTFPFSDARAFYYAYRPTSPTCLAVAAASRRFNNACYVAIDMTTRPAAEQSNFAHWYSFYRTRSLLARSSLSRVFNTQEKLRVAWQNLTNDPLNNGDVINSIAANSTQRAGLFSFIFNNPSNGGTPLRAATKRVGVYLGDTNTGLSTSNPYYDVASNSELSCRQNFHLMVTDGGWNGAAGVTGDFDKQTFSFPEGGRAYAPTSIEASIYGKENINNKNGLADNAFYYWSRDLRSTLPNNVPPSFEDLSVGFFGAAAPLGPNESPGSRDEIFYNPKNDPATWQHMVQYIVGFGVGGDVPFPSSYNALRLGTYNGAAGWPNWGGDDDTNPQVVDDTWHAAINGRGEFFSVDDPDELITALSQVFESVARRVATNTPVSLSSGLLTSETIGYETLFDSSDWSGRVRASRVTASGLGTREWDLACSLTGGPCPDSFSGQVQPPRKIATSDGTAAGGIAFQFANLTSAQKLSLNTNPDTGTNDGIGDKRVAFVRGDQTHEFRNGGVFRDRLNVLGSVVNSEVIVPGTDSYGKDSFGSSAPEYPGLQMNPSAYKDFQDSQASADTVFVGANDGMLHAVSDGSLADGGGAERWAYIPATVVANLNKLTSQKSLQYQSYVDSSPQVRDIFLNGSWRRVLVGGLRLGGQGVYALDVTAPSGAALSASSDTDVAARVLWEFSDKSVGGSQLGFTYGVPFITRLSNGDWVALVPGGYNSDEPDGAATTGDGFGRLFVLRMSDGQVLREFNLGAQSKGLSSIIAGDYVADDSTANVRDVSDVAFAGDLNGNVWRFNFNTTSPASWTANLFFKATANQSITVQPRIARTAYTDIGSGATAQRRKFAVTFGTGKYIEGDDRSTTFQQSYYGVYDQGPNSSRYPFTQGNLVRQLLTTAPGGIRRLTTTQVGANKFGWYFDLLASGERVITKAVLRNTSGTLIFPTLAPLSSDPCAPTAKSFIMIVDASTGGVSGTAAAGVDTDGDGVADTTNAALISPSFDTNADGRVDQSDDKLGAGIEVAGYVAGVTPISSVGGGSAQILLPPSGSGGGATALEIANYEWRRRSWRELFVD